MSQTVKKFALAMIVTMLASCGGDDTQAPTGSTSPTLASPAPPPASPVVGATDKIIYAAARSMTFEARGFFTGDYSMDVRFEADTGFYWIRGPYNTDWAVLKRDPNSTPQTGEPWTNFRSADGTFFLIRASGEATNEEYRYFYSNLTAYGVGLTAFGIPAAANAGPAAAKVTYRGFFETISNETGSYGDWGVLNEGIYGDVEIAFDPATNQASLTLLVPAGENGANLVEATPIALDWTSGANRFTQPDPASSSSLNFPVDGVFTGPGAEELIASLRFEYISKNDGKTYTAMGALIAKR